MIDVFLLRFVTVSGAPDIIESNESAVVMEIGGVVRNLKSGSFSESNKSTRADYLEPRLIDDSTLQFFLTITCSPLESLRQDVRIL